MKNLLIYYGWLNSFNSGQNGWDNEKVAQEMAKYDLLVFGSGIEETSHGDNTNINIIIPRIKALKPSANIFGYVTVNQSFSNFKSKVDKWVDNRGIHGIFMDEAGYDYGSTSTNSREEFNKKVDYIHSQGLLCFVNAWKPEHIIGENNDASYPDSTWNPNELDSNIDSDDWYLLESFAITNNGSYEAKAQWLSRGEEASQLPMNIAGIGCIDESQQDAQDKFDFLYISAKMHDLEGIGSANYESSVSYGASNAKTKFFSRPNVKDLDFDYGDPIKVHASDADLYIKYFKSGILKLDFSSGSEDSELITY